jgi:hypothetical protein
MKIKSDRPLSDQEQERFQEAWLRILKLTQRSLTAAFVMILVIFGYLFFGPTINQWLTPKPVAAVQIKSSKNEAPTEIAEGIHLPTGLIVAEGWELVKRNCTACHSGQLVAQNRATKEGWEKMIRWMQTTQGLWDLGEAEPVILDYLATHYAPEESGRRAAIDVDAIEWYILNIN